MNGNLDLGTCEQALGEINVQLTYLRSCQQVLEARKHELSLADYRLWHRRLRTLVQHTKAARYHLLQVQEGNLHPVIGDPP